MKNNIEQIIEYIKSNYELCDVGVEPTCEGCRAEITMRFLEEVMKNITK